MATKKDKESAELAIERMRERIARIELSSSKLQLTIALVKLATVLVAGLFGVLVIVLRV